MVHNVTREARAVPHFSLVFTAPWNGQGRYSLRPTARTHKNTMYLAGMD
jgi:hypothetical protein